MPEEAKVELEAEEKDISQEKVDITPAPAKVSEEDQLVAKIKTDFEALYGSRLKQTEDRLHGAYRINEKLQKELEQIKTQLPKPTSEIKSDDPWSTIENGPKWKSEIERLAEAKAEEKLKSWQSEQYNQTLVKQQQETLESSKRSVISKYPDLDPEAGNPDTPISKAYVSVLNEHPDWLTNPYGPQLAMYAMEEKLAKDSVPTGGPAKSRASITSLSPSRPTTTGGERVTLTREQKAFCDRHNMKYEDFIKTATALEQGALEA